MAAGARLHRRPVRWLGACRPAAPGARRQAWQRRTDAAGAGNLRLGRAGLGDRADRRAGERDTRYRLGHAADRAVRRGRGRWLHRACRPVGSAGQRRLDEPGAVTWPGPRPRRLDGMVGLPGRPAGRGGHRGRLCLDPARAWRRRARHRGRTGPGHASVPAGSGLARRRPSTPQPGRPGISGACGRSRSGGCRRWRER
jgi:hypothetical protein